ncbi:hypothetical protein N7E81_17390 [Reichenbachiella carrageenanivorans]|uniref:Uncharacterized protein n=1 Tax=Reichenbachiella carrageenanivorans TaxID=2979869 RepID=A0ABY6D5K9_9BACT|nr:hypothetical protein [Reichenbachiella carrageenanivorans]UXX79130.1 hypothetical protein N7E81_17390 [Reichenbachiella carrageenanivorans]
MTSVFRTLRDDEIEIVLNAPAMVAMLIAGADDDVDKDEIAEAIHYATTAKHRYDKLGEYFQDVADKFEDIFKNYIEDLPDHLDTRQHAITSYLRQLNGILPKVQPEVASQLHQFLLDIAKVVAEASGGIFGVKKISKAEAKYLPLDMIEKPADYEMR